jgi:hypothetical protein
MKYILLILFIALQEGSFLGKYCSKSKVNTSSGRMTYETELILKNDGSFILKEDVFTPMGRKIDSMSINGLWEQNASKVLLMKYNNKTEEVLLKQNKIRLKNKGLKMEKCRCK